MAMRGVTDRQSAPAHGISAGAAPKLGLPPRDAVCSSEVFAERWVWRRRNRRVAALSHVLIVLYERFSSREGADFAEAHVVRDA